MQVCASVTRWVRTDISVTFKLVSVPASLESADCAVIVVNRRSGVCSRSTPAVVDVRVSISASFYTVTLTMTTRFLFVSNDQFSPAWKQH